VFNTVLEDIDQGFTAPVKIAAEFDIFLTIHIKLQHFDIQGDAQRFQGFLYKGVNIDLLPFHGDGSRVKLGEFQQRGDQPFDPLQL
jgi:hypothetical protein